MNLPGISHICTIGKLSITNATNQMKDSTGKSTLLTTTALFVFLVPGRLRCLSSPEIHCVSASGWWTPLRSPTFLQVFSLPCLSSTEAFLLYTQLNTRWQPDHRLLLDEPCPRPTPPEGFTWVSLAQAHLMIRPIPQPWLLAAETQGKLPAATFRLKLPWRQEEAWARSQVSSSASWGYLCRTNVQHSPWWS